MKIIIFLVLFNSITCLFAEETNTTRCSLVSEVETYTVSDNFGKSVFTKKIRRRKCVDNIVIKGECLQYETKMVDYNVTAPSYNEAHTKDFSGTMSGLMGVLGGINNSLDMLSG